MQIKSPYSSHVVCFLDLASYMSQSLAHSSQDLDERKVSVGVGAYRDDNGHPYVLPSVREAQHRILAKGMNEEYAGIIGIPSFVHRATMFLYGKDSPVMALSGTGALRVIMTFLQHHLPPRKDGRPHKVHMPNPTWANHLPIASHCNLEPCQYRYYDPKTVSLDFDGMMDDLNKLDDGEVVLFHACAHNPTGIDPTQDQWKDISELCLRKNIFVLMDTAYQGFASGDADKDAWALRYFVSQGHPMMVAQSFAKNFGLYGERVGTVSAVCRSKDEKTRVMEAMKRVIRPMYSNPPIYGARIVDEVLEDPALEAQWRQECLGMANRIHSMRTALRSALERNGSSRDWSHITSQIGMFCYSGLSSDEVDRLRNEYHIYMTQNGRISMAGVTSNNVEYMADAIHKVTSA